MATKTIRQHPSATERDRINRASILAQFNVAIADVLTMCVEHPDFAEVLDTKTVEQPQWLQREIAEHAGAVLDGYIPANFPPGNNCIWQEVQS